MNNPLDLFNPVGSINPVRLIVPVCEVPLPCHDCFVSIPGVDILTFQKGVSG